MEVLLQARELEDAVDVGGNNHRRCAKAPPKSTLQ